MNRLRALLSVLAIPWFVLATVSAARPQAGATLTPDRRTFLVSKDVGAERWSIGATLATTDLDSVLGATGNVFRADGAPPSFILCQVRTDSAGTLRDPESVFRLTCRGTDACPGTARACARDDWRPIAELVEIPASFFLPPGGAGDLAGTAADGAGAPVAPASASSPGASGLAATAQALDRGATLSFDSLSHLVNKDVGAERWSIGLNLVPVVGEGGGSRNQLLSVTGNVFFPDGGAPRFVFCTAREDSAGTLEDAASEFRFRCSGADACAATASACAASGWTTISDDVRLAASFFLPPGGLPPSVQSDPEIVIIGRTSDPPSIVTRDFTVAQGAGTRVAGVGSSSSPASAAAAASMRSRPRASSAGRARPGPAVGPAPIRSARPGGRRAACACRTRR